LTGERETFGTRFGMLMTMIGVAVGLGNVWRFPYMTGRYGGATFVLIYVAAGLLIGVPALMAEWALGRETRRGAAGAYERVGFPLGKPTGWFLFGTVVVAMGYYTNALGWVLYHALAELGRWVGPSFDASAILPPDSGFDPRSFALQLTCTALIIFGCCVVVLRGVRSGIERVSKVVMPLLLGILLLLVLRTLTLPGAWEGVTWYLLKIDTTTLTGGAIAAAVGQAVFSLSLGGTFMVVYGSYLPDRDRLGPNAVWTAVGDIVAGLLAGLAIIPAVIALGLEPASGPALLFDTLPQVFARMPFGTLLGALFFIGLFAAAYLSDVAAFEVLVAGLTDNTRLGRRGAVWLMATIVFVVAIPPMINLRIFVPWDMTFGSGMQTLGSLLAVVALAWCLDRSAALRQLDPDHPRLAVLLFYWLRFVVPSVIVAVGVWWLLSDVLGIASSP
jgi:NSS family neurotransmitter:Na+ symporter